MFNTFRTRAKLIHFFDIQRKYERKIIKYSKIHHFSFCNSSTIVCSSLPFELSAPPTSCCPIRSRPRGGRAGRRLPASPAIQSPLPYPALQEILLFFNLDIFHILTFLLKVFIKKMNSTFVRENCHSTLNPSNEVSFTSELNVENL